MTQGNLWHLQSKAQALLPNEPIALCMRELDPRSYYKNVNIRSLPERGLAYYGHLRICGSVWHCPICASIILEHRCDEVMDALTAWKARGGSVLMATFSVFNKPGSSLTSLLDPLEMSMKLLRQGRKAQEIKEAFRISGTISKRAAHYTKYGWQPSVCLLIFFGDKIGITVENSLIYTEEYRASEETIRYKDVLQDRWQQISKMKGDITNVFDITFEEDFDNIVTCIENFDKDLFDGIYDESSKNDISIEKDKRLTPFAILNLAAQGINKFEELFKEYATCYKGKRLVAWSKYLRSTINPRWGKFGEKADYEVVYEEANDKSKIIATLTWEQWNVVVANEMRGKLLEVAKSGKWIDTLRFLVALGDHENIE